MNNAKNYGFTLIVTLFYIAWRNEHLRQNLTKPVIILFILIVTAIVMNPVSSSLENYYPQQNPAEVAAFSIGDTVLSGTDVVDNSKIRKVPVISNPGYLVNDIREHEFFDLSQHLQLVLWKRQATILQAAEFPGMELPRTSAVRVYWPWKTTN